MAYFKEGFIFNSPAYDWERFMEFFITSVLELVFIFSCAIIFIILFSISFTSFRENERRAGILSLILSLFFSGLFLTIIIFDFPQKKIIIFLFCILLPVAALLLFIPYDNKKKRPVKIPTGRFDERDIMFSRRLLVEGSEDFTEYYKRNSGKKLLDDKFRSKPGLLEEDSLFYHPVAFSAAKASFTAVKAFHSTLDKTGKLRKRIFMDPSVITEFIKNWAMKLGAVSVGISELKDYHLYSIIGRGPHYGEPVVLQHKFAVAITVEMDKKMIDSAPEAPIIMESAQQYLESGGIAVQIAEFIKNLGYPARAHIDGNYRVICPFVARDAGLGEIGRMGLLMTPQLGPRVRIAVVTTDLPLIPDNDSPDQTIIDFCEKCKKCADVCPSRAIPFGNRSETEGVSHWRINSEACYTYWCSTGTDCGKCVSVCPYSHPDSFFHNIVRKGIRNSSLFRNFAIKMDDFFYGKKPPSSEFPDWLKIDAKRKGIGE